MVVWERRRFRQDASSSAMSPRAAWPICPRKPLGRSLGTNIMWNSPSSICHGTAIWYYMGKYGICLISSHMEQAFIPIWKANKQPKSDIMWNNLSYGFQRSIWNKILPNMGTNIIWLAGKSANPLLMKVSKGTPSVNEDMFIYVSCEQCSTSPYNSIILVGL